FVRAEEEQASAGLDDESIGPRLIASEILDQRQQPAADLAAVLPLDLLARALERIAEAIAIERLQEVIERPHLEGAKRVLIVRRYEDDQRHLLGADGLNHLEAVHLRHLDVEEHEVGRQLDDGFGGFFAVAA